MSKLDPAQIVDEALAVVRSDGEAALSMRLLATKLGVPPPMALYHHFADRDALLLALVERVSEKIVFPATSHDPVRDSVDLALCLHGFLVEHPWMIRLISTGRLASPDGLRFPEGFLILCTERRALRRGSFHVLPHHVRDHPRTGHHHLRPAEPSERAPPT